MEREKNGLRWLYLLAAIPVVLLFGFYLWAETPPQPMPEALRALESVDSVSVRESSEGWWEFKPTAAQPARAFILYPGGRVDERSYAPLARDIAVNGYLVIVPDMPLNLAVFDQNRADDIIAAYPDISAWGIGGHSLGGAMAASYAEANPMRVAALVMWAAVPAENVSLIDADFPVAVIYGSRDGLLTTGEIETSQRQYPTGTQFVRIDGGNHAQFGWYGEQNGDLAPGITRREQGTQIIAATVGTLLAMDGQ